MQTNRHWGGALLLGLIPVLCSFAAPAPTPEPPKLQATLEGHKYLVSWIGFSPDGKTLASIDSGARDSGTNTVKLWSVKDAKAIATLEGHEGLVHALAFGPDGKSFATGGDKCIKLWTLTDNQPTIKDTINTWSGRLLFSPDGKTLVSESGNISGIQLWDLETKKARGTLKLTDHESVKSFRYTTDGKLLLVTVKLGNDYGNYLYDVGEGKKLVKLKEEAEGHASSSVFSSDGKTIAGSGYNTICVWEVDTGKPKVTVKVDDMITPLAFNPKGTLLAVGRRPRNDNRVGTISLIDAATGNELTVLKGHNSAVGCLAFSPDGKTLASCGIGLNQPIKLWSIPDVIKAEKSEAVPEGKK
jgi:WD40 repeat protein